MSGNSLRSQPDIFLIILIVILICFYQTVAGRLEAVSECLIWFHIKEGENFNRKNTLSILRIEI